MSVSVYWAHYERLDRETAMCLQCAKQVKMLVVSTTGLTSHLQAKHGAAFGALTASRESGPSASPSSSAPKKKKFQATITESFERDTLPL